MTIPTKQNLSGKELLDRARLRFAARQGNVPTAPPPLQRRPSESSPARLAQIPSALFDNLRTKTTLLTPEEVGELLGISAARVRDLTRKRLIRAVQCGSQKGLRFVPSEVEDFIRRQSTF